MFAGLLDNLGQRGAFGIVWYLFAADQCNSDYRRYVLISRLGKYCELILFFAEM